MFWLMDILEPASDGLTSPPNAGGETEKSDGQERGERRERIMERRTGMEKWQDGSKVPDWLHGKNPLNVTESLTEWMLLALMEKLETELADLRRREGNTLIE
jgi:potassium channel subfamily K